MAIRYNSGAAREATGLKQMPIRARTHKTGAGGMSALGAKRKGPIGKPR